MTKLAINIFSDFFFVSALVCHQSCLIRQKVVTGQTRKPNVLGHVLVKNSVIEQHHCGSFLDIKICLNSLLMIIILGYSRNVYHLPKWNSLIHSLFCFQRNNTWWTELTWRVYAEGLIKTSEQNSQFKDFSDFRGLEILCLLPMWYPREAAVGK